MKPRWKNNSLGFRYQCLTELDGSGANSTATSSSRHVQTLSLRTVRRFLSAALEKTSHFGSSLGAWRPPRGGPGTCGLHYIVFIFCTCLSSQMDPQATKAIPRQVKTVIFDVVFLSEAWNVISHQPWERSIPRLWFTCYRP